MLLFFMLAYATIRIYQIGKGIRMTINVEYNDQTQIIAVRGKSKFETYTKLSYAEVALVFPPVEDDDEDRSEYTLEDC